MLPIRASRVIALDGDGLSLADIDLDKGRAQDFVAGQTAMVNYCDDLARSAYVSGNLRLHISLFCRLHSLGYSFFDERAGYLRQAQIYITDSNLVPPGPEAVLSELEQMCDYINDNWNLSPPLHIASFLMWRLLWIHPFTDGNGSIARLVSFLLFQVRCRRLLGPARGVFEAIAKNRDQYYYALSAADQQWAKGILDLTELETFLSQTFATS